MFLTDKLQEIQDRCGYLPDEDLKKLADEYFLSLSEVKGIASFYEFFVFEKGRMTDPIQDLYPVRKRGTLLEPASGYTGYQKAKEAPGDIIREINEAHLTGRSGGGFPTGKKWEITANEKADHKYIICNADEGEPGTGKDRAVLKENPRSVIEGMAIAGLAVGASSGFIYLRGEYADLCGSIEEEIQKADIGDFRICVVKGHGAYVCGDETALISSMENQRGETRLKPPYPGVKGLFGQPTVVNNAETFSCVSWIMRHGAKVFAEKGTSDCTGPKLFTVLGCVKNPGVYEAEAGITLQDLVDMAGGATEKIRAVLTGGGSGTIVRPDMTMILSPSGCRDKEASFGVASVRLIGEQEDLTEVLEKLTGFYAKESCGICVPCRVGLNQLNRLIRDYEEGKAPSEVRKMVRDLTEHIIQNARCAMAPAAVTPVVSALDHFPEVLL